MPISIMPSFRPVRAPVTNYVDPLGSVVRGAQMGTNLAYNLSGIPGETNRTNLAVLKEQLAQSQARTPIMLEELSPEAREARLFQRQATGQAAAEMLAGGTGRATNRRIAEITAEDTLTNLPGSLEAGRSMAGLKVKELQGKIAKGEAATNLLESQAAGQLTAAQKLELQKLKNEGAAAARAVGASSKKTEIAPHLQTRLKNNTREMMTVTEQLKSINARAMPTPTGLVQSPEDKAETERLKSRLDALERDNRSIERQIEQADPRVAARPGSVMDQIREASGMNIQGGTTVSGNIMNSSRSLFPRAEISESVEEAPQVQSQVQTEKFDSLEQAQEALDSGAIQRGTVITYVDENGDEQIADIE